MAGTVDPERYTASFDPSVNALRGSEAQTKAAAQEFNVFAARVPGKTPESCAIDPTAGSRWQRSSSCCWPRTSPSLYRLCLPCRPRRAAPEPRVLLE